MRRYGSLLAVVLLSFTLAAPPALAGRNADVRRIKAQSGASTALDRLWRSLRSLWAANGSSIDPFGKPGQASTTPAPPPTADAGSSIDPFGNH